MIAFLISWPGLALALFFYLILVGFAHRRLQRRFLSTKRRRYDLLLALLWPVLLPYWIGRGL